MAKDTGFDSRDIAWDNKGYARDIDFNKSDQNNNSSLSKETNICGSVMGYISSLQEISVQEKLLQNSIDKNLFTIQKTLCGLKNGASLGLVSSITIVLQIIFCYIFSYEIIIDMFKDKYSLGLFIKYLPAIITVVVTIYISNLSKYAIGDYTSSALKTFYVGKMVATVLVSFVIFFSFYYLEFILDKTTFNEATTYAKNIFLHNIETTFYVTTILILLASFLPFLFYGFRKILFNSSQKFKYEKY